MTAQDDPVRCGICARGSGAVRDEKGKRVLPCPPHDWGPSEIGRDGKWTRSCNNCSTFQINEQHYERENEISKVTITGLWIRNHGDVLEVLVERDGEWRLVLSELGWDGENGNISHIVEPLGLRRGKPDPLTEDD